MRDCLTSSGGLCFYVVILTVKPSYHEVLRYCFNAREKLYQRKNIKPNNWVIEYIGCNFWNKTLKSEVKNSRNIPFETLSDIKKVCTRNFVSNLISGIYIFLSLKKSVYRPQG